MREKSNWYYTTEYLCKVCGAEGMSRLDNYDYIVFCGKVLKKLMTTVGLWVKLKDEYGDKGSLGQNRKMVLLLAAVEDKNVSDVLPRTMVMYGLAPEVETLYADNVEDFCSSLRKIASASEQEQDKRCLLVTDERYKYVVQRIKERELPELGADYLIVR